MAVEFILLELDNLHTIIPPYYIYIYIHLTAALFLLFTHKCG